MDKEKHYFNIHSPEYNILNTPCGEPCPSKGSGWNHSKATIEKMPRSALNRSNSNLSLYNPSGIKIEVTDWINNKKTKYHAIKAAARDLGIDTRYIEHYIYVNDSKPVLGKYIFELVNTTLGTNIEQKMQKSSKKLEVTDVLNNKVSIYPSRILLL